MGTASITSEVCLPIIRFFLQRLTLPACADSVFVDAIRDRLVALDPAHVAPRSGGLCLPRIPFFLRTLILRSSTDRVLDDAIRTRFVASDHTHVTQRSLD